MILRLLWILWLVTCSGANAEQFKHTIKISTKGNDSACLVNESIACKTLDYVFNAVINQNSTALFIEPGYYNLNLSFAFWHVKQFAIIGSSSSSINSQNVIVVNCSSLAGLSFIYSEDIIMKNITFSSCGALQNSTSRRHPQFLAGLFFVNCISLEMENVLVIDGPGIGMQLYDVTGTVTISNCHFIRNGKNSETNITSTVVPSGGGIYLEYTFRGGLWPFNTTPNHIYQENSTFLFENCLFEHNISPKYDCDSAFNPNVSNHVAFGRGGGVSVFMKGNARNNSLNFKVCHFVNNTAEWGAGFFIEFHDKVQNNTVTFSQTEFSGNRAQIGGGGTRIGLITCTRLQSTKIIPNIVIHISCLFKKNMAILGGAVSFYGTKKLAYSTFKGSSIKFTSCIFNGNGATVGSAIGCALWSSSDFWASQLGNPVPLSFINCNFTKNMIIFTEDNKVIGTGGFYSQGIPISLSNVNFVLNNGSAVVLDSANVQIKGNVVFSNNRGENGGAIALYGSSILHLTRQSQLIFLNNTCDSKGGAIYVRSPGPSLVAFKTTGINTHGCFFAYTKEDHFNPDKWNVSVKFMGNTGPDSGSGHSVFATTLQYCRSPGDGRINPALEWKTFHYFFANGTRSDMVHEIVTDAVEMKVDRSEWNVTNDKSFSPMLRLFDEKNNSVYGLINVKLQANSPVVLDPPSAYYLAKDRIQSLVIQGERSTHYNVTLTTVDTQLVFQEIHNAIIKECNPGFVPKNITCSCDLSDIGVSRCEDKNQLLFLLKDYWGGYVVESSNKRKFVTVPCPENYCYCNRSRHSGHAASDGECFFDILTQCQGKRKDQLCGICKGGYSLIVGVDACVDNCMNGLRWIGYLFGLLSFLTFLVLVIIVINFDPFSAYLNAWLYSYQVILLLLPEGITLDPFLTFIVGLANVRIIGFGGVCMWPSMDDLQKLAFNYVFPAYVFLCLFVLNNVALKFPNNYFTRRLTRTSTARAFCTLFVLCYSTIVFISLNILYPIKIGNKYFVFNQGTEEYFSSYHVGFAIVAILLLIFVGILFPLVLIQRRCFSFIDKFLMRLLLDTFQNCFRDGFKWCAGFYFICRFVMLFISTFTPDGALKVSLLQSACCVILTVFVLCKPYAESDGLISYHILNTLDAVLLCNLCILSSFGSSLFGIFATSLYYNHFKIVIEILGYIPLLYFFWLLGYFLIKKCFSNYIFLQNVDE